MTDEKILDLPFDQTNEQILVAAALTSPEACEQLAKLVPRADYFVDDAAAATWSAVLELRRRRVDVDLPAVQAAAGQKAPPQYLADLCAAYPTPPRNLLHHVEALRWDASKAAAVRGPVAGLLEALRDPGCKPDKVRALGKAVAKALDVATDNRFMRDPTALAREIEAELLERRDRANYPLGLSGLDAGPDGRPMLTPGAAPTFVTTVTGCSGNGKSAVAAMIALRQAELGRRVLYGAWEMGSKETMMLLALMSLAIEQPNAGWSTIDMRAGAFDDEQIRFVKERGEELGQYIKFFDAPFQAETSRRYRNNDAIDMVAHQIADSGCDVYVLDLWERMIPDASPEDERRALFRQQQVTQETRTHGVLVAQQKVKEIEASEDKRPTRGGILGSGAWIEISDHIIGTFRPALYKRVPDTVMELMVLKQRHGRWPFTVECTWDHRTYRLSNGREVSTLGGEQSEESAGVDKFLGSKRRRRP